MNIPLNIDWRQILLHLFNFVILMGGLYFLLYSPIKRFMAKRQEYYRQIDNGAEQKRLSADEMEKTAARRLDEVEQEIVRQRLKAEEDIRCQAALRLQEAREQAEKIIADAKKSAETEKKAILEDAQKDIIAMTKEASAKIVYEDTNEAFDVFLELAERDMKDGK